MKKTKRLERVATIAKNNENIQLINWKKAKNDLESASDRLTQLEKYFNNYASISDDPIISAKLYANKQHILDLVREAVIYQRNEIKRLEEGESFERSVLTTKTQEKKINEKLVQNKVANNLMKSRKKENIASEEITLQFFYKNNTTKV